MSTPLETSSILVIYLFAFAGLAFGGYNIYKILNVEPKAKSHRKDEENQNTYDNTHLINSEPTLTEKNIEEMRGIHLQIAEGSNIFLLTEYLYLCVFIAIMSALIYFFGEMKQWVPFTTISFILGAFTSMLCGFIGMRIAVNSNWKTTYSAYFGLGEAFRTAYYGACVMGFCLVSTSIIVLMTIILIYKAIIIEKPEDYLLLFEVISGYGLGGSAVALFCRVGGGIYTKAADVGADLVAKLEFGYEEDDPKNPACIADNVGDNVGDIAGMGSDLFGSMAESLCAALLVGSHSPEMNLMGAYYYPISIIACSIIVCIGTAIAGFAMASWINNYERLELTIKLQLVISTLLIIPIIAILSCYCLPTVFNIGIKGTLLYKEDVSGKLTMICPISGLISGLLIGISTEYYTSMTYSPVQGLVEGCKKGAAINIILGLSLGYLSNVIPTILIAATIVSSYLISGIYGIALAAIGMLANLPICLAIDSYGPISDNAGGIASMCNLPEEIREITDNLDSAGNTTAAIGKGFAIGSACLVSLSLFGAFVTATKITSLNLVSPVILSSLVIGAMIPYLFSALTMRAVGNAAEKMVEAVREDFISLESLGPGVEKKPDSAKCIKISTDASLNQMFLPGAIVILTPLLGGTFFGPTCVSGLLIGIIISGIQLAISMANSGGAWDNCKKSIKNKGLVLHGVEYYSAILATKKEVLEKKEMSLNLLISYGVKELSTLKDEIAAIKKEIEDIHNKITHHRALSEEELVIISHDFKDKTNNYYSRTESASITGDTVGDPLKDTSGPSLNILIKLSSILSVVFSPLFVKTSFFNKSITGTA